MAEVFLLGSVDGRLLAVLINTSEDGVEHYDVTSMFSHSKQLLHFCRVHKATRITVSSEVRDWPKDHPLYWSVEAAQSYNKEQSCQK